MRSSTGFKRWILLASCVLPLSACTFLDSFVPRQGEDTDVIDREKRYSINDFRDLNKIDQDKDAEPTVTAELGAPPIPDIAQVLAAPRAPKVANTKLVTLAVTDDVPLRDVLFELGRLANVDIEVGPGLDTTGINLRATDRPFNEVIERIATLANLRYSTVGGSIRVERDVPYVKNYSMDFLNLVRSSTTSYSLSTSIISGGGGSSGGSSSSSSSSSSSGGSSGGAAGVGTSGSSSSISGTADSDLWSSLEASVTEILNYKPAEATSTTDANAQQPQPQPAQGADGAAAGAVVINRQAGVLTVNATQRQHEMIDNFLRLMTRNASAQVLIEAKIVEVALSDQFASGVDWNQVIGNAAELSVGFGKNLPLDPVTGETLVTDRIGDGAPFTFGINKGDLGAVLALTQNFGTTRTLSSPRLSAINNQQAVLTFARNQVYFNCEYTPGTSTINTSTSETTSATEPTLDCEQLTVPIGIILSIMPSVNLDTQEVTLNVRPTLTRQVDTIPSPVTGFLRSIAETEEAADLIPDITVPVIESREIDSITKVKSGGVMIIGGLMEDTTRNTENGVPGAAEIPLFGNLFKGRSEDSTKRELIIFIKATIVNSDGSTHTTDHKVYNKFFHDPRPLFPEDKKQ